ncbi:CheY-like chemotaxis protein [Bradyrhizobium sp. i1.4.4]
MAKTVLIVEDNELNMKLFRDLLEAHGYQTSGTSNGYEALDLVRKMRPDLVLMDIQLPQGLGPGGHALDQGRSGAARHSRRRGHGVRDEGRRRAHPRGRLRGLFVQADLGRQIH